MYRRKINLRASSLLLLRYGIACLVLLISLTALALPSDQDQPYYISSDQAIYDRNTHVITYLGNVHVTQGSSQLDGDKAVVYQDKQNTITHLIAYGNLAQYSTLPEPGKDRLYAKAQRIIYDPNKKVVWLLEDGHVNEGNEIFSGPHIWYNMTDGLVRSSPIISHQRTIITLPQ